MRDDFWMAATPVHEGPGDPPARRGEHAAAVDLFDPRHAEEGADGIRSGLRGVAREDRLTSAATRSISGSSRHGACPGRQDHLRAVGSVRRDGEGEAVDPCHAQGGGRHGGVGLTFLEETFSASTAPPEHRFHQKAAQAVLKALLARERHRHQGADEITPGVAGSIGLCEPPQGLR